MTKHFLQELLTQAGMDKDLLIIYRGFVDFTGDRDAGAMLGRLLFWHGRGELGDGWIYKSDADWMEELYLTRHAVRKARTRLEEMGFLTTRRQMARAKGSETTHYRLDVSAFQERWDGWIAVQAAPSENEQCPAPAPAPLSESEQVTVRIQTGHCADPDRSLSESRQPITGENTGSTSSTTPERERATASLSPKFSVLDGGTANGTQRADHAPPPPDSAAPPTPTDGADLIAALRLACNVASRASPRTEQALRDTAQRLLDRGYTTEAIGRTRRYFGEVVFSDNRPPHLSQVEDHIEQAQSWVPGAGGRGKDDKGQGKMASVNTGTLPPVVRADIARKARERQDAARVAGKGITI